MASLEEVDDSSVSSANQEEEEEPRDAISEPPTKKSKVIAATPLETSDATASNTVPKQHPIIILLDQASLETVKNRRGVYELLNCDDHRDVCRKLKKNPNDYRPDILHQELLSIIDSPLNKAGLVRVYIKSKKNVLIHVNHQIRIPRTYKRFAGLMVQLLHKLKIKASSTSTTLLKVIKNPFSQYLPAGTQCYSMSVAGTLYRPINLAKQLVPTSSKKPPVCFIVGAMASGHIVLDDHPYIQSTFSISEYPLSGAVAVSRLLGGIEQHWGIV